MILKGFRFLKNIPKIVSLISFENKKYKMSTNNLFFAEEVILKTLL